MRASESEVELESGVLAVLDTTSNVNTQRLMLLEKFGMSFRTWVRCGDESEVAWQLHLSRFQ